jgi:hypothetical protein
MSAGSFTREGDPHYGTEACWDAGTIRKDAGMNPFASPAWLYKPWHGTQNEAICKGFPGPGNGVKCNGAGPGVAVELMPGCVF